MKRFMNKKVATIGLAAGLILGGAGAAFAYFTTTGSGSGSASTGSAGTWSVPNAGVVTTGTLYPGQSSATIAAVVQNPTGHGYQGLNNLEVQITGVTEGSPGNTAPFSSDPACTVADYALASTNNGYVLSKNVNANDTANFALSTVSDIAPDHFAVTSGAGAPVDNASTGNALPSGLTVIMLDTGANQDRCQGASVTLTVSAS